MRTWYGHNCWPATFVRARDGDTVVLLVDLGFDTRREIAVRLVGIESWELDSPNKSRAENCAMVISAARGNQQCTFYPSTRGPDKYGRYRGRVQFSDGDLAKIIVDVGLAWYVTGADHGTTGSPVDAGKVTP